MNLWAVVLWLVFFNKKDKKMVPRITAEIYDALDHDAEYVTLACKNLRKDVAALGLELVAVKGRFQLKDGDGNILYHGGKGFRGIRAYVWGYAAGLKAGKQ